MWWRSGRTVAVSLLAGWFSIVPMALAEDVKGSSDHALLPRFPGATIKAYKAANYDEAELPNSRIDSRDAPLLQLAGRVTQIGYEVPATTSVAELAANYASLLDREHFTKVFSCRGDACGEQFASVVVNSGKVMPDAFPVAFNDKARAYLGKRSDAAGDTWVFLYLTDGSSSNERNNIYEEIVEPKALDTNQIRTIDAATLKGDIARDGRVALYGLYFDTDRSEVRADSKPQLDQMIAVLHDNPGWRVYIVGHTDNRGGLAHNLALSQARADAVTKALVEQGKIGADRIVARGVASLAPVASNADEAGQARNWRVEMVLQ